MPAFLHWLHVYFDDDSCMEVTALKGSCGDVQYFADRIIARVASDMATWLAASPHQRRNNNRWLPPRCGGADR